jgi:hypothetical protein
MDHFWEKRKGTGMKKRLKWQAPKNCRGIGCVEVAKPELDRVLVRSSNNKRRKVEMTGGEWTDFITAVRNGEYDPKIGTE